MRTRTRPDGAPLRIYRTVPSQVIGWGMVGGALLLSLLTARDLIEGRTSGPVDVVPPLALIVGVAAVAMVLFLRPKAVLYPDRVELTNVLSDVVVPFTRVEDVTFQWALELHDDQGRRHSAWAVPVRREMVRRRSIDDFAETTRRRGSAGTTAQTAADEVLRALGRWRLEGGEAAADAPDAPRVTQTVAWPAVVALGLAIALAVAALLG